MPLNIKKCEHILNLDGMLKPKGNVCEECIKNGDTWVHLRTCQSCGVTLCCDSSSNKHASKHFQTTQHPVIISAEPGEKWIWCYVDNALVRY